MGTILTTEHNTEPLLKNETVHVDDITFTENKNEKYQKMMENFEKISKHVPNDEQQLGAVKSFFDGKMSYAEMRMYAG